MDREVVGEEPEFCGSRVQTSPGMDVEEGEPEFTPSIYIESDRIRA